MCNMCSSHSHIQRKEAETGKSQGLVDQRAWQREGWKTRDLDSNKKERSVLLVVFETPSWFVASGCLHVHPRTCEHKYINQKWKEIARNASDITETNFSPASHHWLIHTEGCTGIYHNIMSENRQATTDRREQKVFKL